MTAEMLDILAPGLHVEGGSADELIHAETLAYQPARGGYMFALVRLVNGRFAAIWQTHAIIADSLATLITSDSQESLLNGHERGLVLAAQQN